MALCEKMHAMKLTVLVDNKAGKGLEPEHGLSFFIEANGRRILFDTGKGEALPYNANALGVSLSNLDAVVLSHGHYDHTGGLPFVFAQNKEAPIYCHPSVCKDRFSIRAGEPRPISMPPSVRESFNALLPERVRYVTEPMELFPGIVVAGEIPRNETWEDTGGPFFIDKEGEHPDAIEDDTALWVETPSGIVAVAGCSHSGIVNILNHIRRLRPDKKLRAVIGGFHLLEASDERVSRTIAAFEDLSLETVIPCHCTGPRQIRMLEEAFGDRFLQCRSGEIFHF